MIQYTVNTTLVEMIYKYIILIKIKIEQIKNFKHHNKTNSIAQSLRNPDIFRTICRLLFWVGHRIVQILILNLK